jgi:hypothetical protein
MTTDTPEIDAEASFAASIAKYQNHDRRVAEARPAKKAALFDALARAGITSVVVNFDGYGDSGQIERTDVRIGDAEAKLPEDRIEFVEPVFGDPEKVQRSTHTVTDAIETPVYAFLGDPWWVGEQRRRLWRRYVRRREADDHARLQRAVHGVLLLLPYFLGRPSWDIAITTRSPRRANGAGRRRTISRSISGSTSRRS